MMRYSTEKGTVTISDEVVSNIAGTAASAAFGVKGMAVRSVTDGLVHLLRREAVDKGVQVTYNEDNSLSVELHIMIEHGVNIAAIGPSIINRVNYEVTKTTGVEVKTVNVYIDSISVE